MILPPIFSTIIIMPHNYWGEAKTKFPLPSYPKEDAFEDSTKYEAAVDSFSMDHQWVLAEHSTWVDVMNCDTCVTCHTCHTSVTDFRPKSGNPMEVTLVTSPKLYIVSHAKGTDFP